MSFKRDREIHTLNWRRQTISMSSFAKFYLHSVSLSHSFTLYVTLVAFVLTPVWLRLNRFSTQIHLKWFWKRLTTVSQYKHTHAADREKERECVTFMDVWPWFEMWRQIDTKNPVDSQRMCKHKNHTQRRFIHTSRAQQQQQQQKLLFSSCKLQISYPSKLTLYFFFGFSLSFESVFAYFSSISSPFPSVVIVARASTKNFSAYINM